jgi:transposase-like protein
VEGGSEESSGENWGESEFRAVALGDRRLEQRWKRLAEDLAARPQAPSNHASEDWAATRAASRFCENAKGTAEKSFTAHRRNTGQRISTHEVGLAIQDPTSLNYRLHPQTTGLGPSGDSRSAAHGLRMHSTLVVTAAGLPLGLLTHELWARAGDKEQNSRERKNTAMEEKESYRGIPALPKTAERTPAPTRVVTLCEREADIYEFLAEAQRWAAQCVVRAAWERHLHHPDSPRLWPLVEAQAITG